MPLSAHMGISRTLEKTCHNFHWTGITVDVRKYRKSCDVCLRTRRKDGIPKSPLQNKENLVDKGFHKVATDLVGRLPLPNNKNQCVLTLFVGLLMIILVIKIDFYILLSLLIMSLYKKRVKSVVIPFNYFCKMYF